MRAAVSGSGNMVCGSFAAPNDNRQYTVTNIHSLSDKKNISLGFDPAMLECLSVRNTIRWCAMPVPSLAALF
jgi:hypothetical protein